MDDLIKNVQNEGYGCYVGSQFYGILVYADDILLLAPSLNALQKMLDVCTSFSDVTGLEFNCKKTMCIDFHGNDKCVSNVEFSVFLHKKLLKWSNTVKHLGHTLTCCLTCDEDINQKKGQFIACVNNILTEFSFAHPKVKARLLSIYGTSFYGSSLWDLYGKAANRLYTTWNIAVRRLFNLPYRTHCRFLDDISELIHVNVSLKLRFVKFIISLLNSDNILIKNLLQYTMESNMFCTGLTLNRILSEFDICTPSTFSSNCIDIPGMIRRHYQQRDNLSIEDLYHCGIIKEMINCLHDSHECGLSKEECNFILNDLATL